MPGVIQNKGAFHGTGVLARSGVITIAQTQAQKDAASYRALLAANGKTLLAADYNSLLTFATQLYALVGRRDFITLRSSQNMGSGTTAYTFHGKPCTLTNGPTWGADEMTFSGLGSRLVYPGNLYTANPDWGFMQVAQGYLRAFGGGFGGNYGNATIGPLVSGYGDSFYCFNNGVSQAWVALRWNSTSRSMITTILTGQNSGWVARDAETLVACTPQEQTYGAYTKTASTNLFHAGEIADTGLQASPLKGSFLLLPTPKAQVQAAYQAIITLYKSTIGQGLALP